MKKMWQSIIGISVAASLMLPASFTSAENIVPGDSLGEFISESFEGGEEEYSEWKEWSDCQAEVSIEYPECSDAKDGKHAAAITYDFSKMTEQNVASYNKSIGIVAEDYVSGNLIAPKRNGYNAKEFSFWYYGDGLGDSLVIELKRGSDNTSIRNVKTVDFTGWKELTVPLGTDEEVRLSNIQLYCEETSYEEILKRVPTTAYIDRLSVKYELASEMFTVVGDDFESRKWMTAGAVNYSVENPSSEQTRFGNGALKLSYSNLSAATSYFDIHSEHYWEGGYAAPYSDGDEIDYFGAWIYGDGSNMLLQLVINNGASDGARAFVAQPFENKGDSEMQRISWKDEWKYVKFYPADSYGGSLKFQPRFRMICGENSTAYSGGITEGAVFIDQLEVHYKDKGTCTEFNTTNFETLSDGTYPAANIVDDFEKRSWEYEQGQSGSRNGWSMEVEPTLSNAREEGNSVYKLHYTTNDANTGWLNIYPQGTFVLTPAEGESIECIKMWIYSDIASGDNFELVTAPVSDRSQTSVWVMKKDGNQHFVDWSDGWRLVTFYTDKAFDEEIALNFMCLTATNSGTKDRTVYWDDMYFDSVGSSLNMEYDVSEESDWADANSQSVQINKVLPAYGLGMKLKGDGSGNIMTVTFTDDKTEPTLTVSNPVKLDFTDERYCEFYIREPIDGNIYVSSINIDKGSESQADEGTVSIISVERLYSSPQNTSCALDGTENVGVTTDKAVIVFSPAADNRTINSGTIIAKENGKAISVKLEENLNGTISVVFPKKLKHSSAYTITVTDGVRDLAGQSCGAEFSFTTEKKAVYVSNPGYKHGGEAITDLANIEPGLIEVTFDYTNLANHENAAFAVALYDGETLEAIDCINCAGVEEGYTTSEKAELTLTEKPDNPIIKIFAFESMSSLKPIGE